MTLNVGVFSDHAGISLKKDIMDLLFSKCVFHDYGVYDDQPSDYPLIAKKAAHMIKDGTIDRAILICGTGIGICMAANRFSWMRSFVAHTLEECQKARAHNNANTICFSGRTQTASQVLPLLEAFLSFGFEGDRHEQRVELLTTLNHD